MNKHSPPQGCRRLQRLGVAVLALSLTACASVQELLGTSDVPPGWNPNAPLAVAPIKPLVPVVNRTPFTTHLLDTSLPNSAAPVPLAPPMPSGTVLYPWRVVPGAQVLAVAPAMAPQPIPPAPAPSVPLTQAAVCAPTPACQAAAPVKKATHHHHVYRVQQPRPKRMVTRTATAQRRVVTPTRPARSTRSTTAARTPSPRRNPNVPLDCTNLWRTNPYLADKLHCRPLTQNAPNAPTPSTNGAN